MNKFKLLGLTFLMIFSGSAIAQHTGGSLDTESEIVMTKAELESFLQKVAETRRQKLRENKRMKNKLELYQLREEHRNKYGNGYGGYNAYNVSREDLIREIDRLNYRVDQLSRGVYGYGNGRDNSTILMPGQGSSSYLPGNSNVPVNNDAYTIRRLQQEVDSLKAQQRKLLAANNIAPSGENSDIENRFAELEERLANADTPAERRDVLADLLNKFKNFKKQVFFANDSDKLSSNDAAYIKDVTEVLKKNPELSVVLEGWASTRGNANYNKQLSMRRSESVERALLDNGISPARIVSSFKGEDNTVSEAEARRVDMSIILK